MAHQPRQFDVVLERAEEGGFVVSVPDLPGVWTQGETRDEALANVSEAIAGYLETLEAEGWPVPEPWSNAPLGVPEASLASRR